MSKRTRRDFSGDSNFWNIVDQWVRETGVEAVSNSPNHRLYRKGRERLDFPIMVEIRNDNGQVHLEAWVKASALDRGRALFLVPAEMGLESGGPQMMMARNTGRKLVNALLARLGQQLIA